MFPVGLKYRMNITAYIVYIIITWLITVKVGHLFYKNGRYYILGILKGDEVFTDFINKILLLCYYLTNLGYAAVMLRLWKTISSFTELVASVSSMTGRIVLSLAIIHYVNMYAIIIIGKRQQFLTHHKK